MLLELFFKPNVCTHEKISPDMEHGYCPDCGQYIENQWFISRCACCGIKHKVKIIKESVAADARFCKNCGNGVFVIEKLPKINFIDVHYAALLKVVIANSKQSFTQSWCEDIHFTPRLLPDYSK